MALSLNSFGQTNSDKAVIFVHGVNGDPHETWTNASASFSWPEALSAHSPWAVYSLGYPAATNLGQTMPMQDRAISVFEYLDDIGGLADKDVVFVCHSFGGIIIKQMLRHLCEHNHEFLGRVAGIVFVSTPHHGSIVASLGNFLRNFIASTVTLEDLRFGAPALADLNRWFRGRDFPPVLSFGETRRLRRFGLRIWPIIVSGISADPAIKGSTTIPIDADHFEICKPTGRNAAQYVSTMAFLEKVFALPAVYQRHPKQVAAIAYRKHDAQIEFLLVRTTGGRWTFPKGHIEDHLGEPGSAANEALEEAGASGKVADRPLCHYLHSKQEWKDDRSDATTFCVAAYLFEVDNDRARKPERNRKPTWMSPEKAKTELARDRDYPFDQELRNLVDRAVAAISGQ